MTPTFQKPNLTGSAIQGKPAVFPVCSGFIRNYISNIWMILLTVSMVALTGLSDLKAATYYVSPSGSSSNSGTSASSPWPVQYAADRTNPGDIVYFLSGTYYVTTDPWLKITRSGSSSAYITYAAAPGHKPVVQCPNPCTAWVVIKVLANYIIIDGFELVGNNANITLQMAEANYNSKIAGGNNWTEYAKTNTGGIGIGNDKTVVPHHVIVRNCIVHDFPGGGIGSDVADFITIENNIVYNTAWYSMYANSGISVFHNQNTASSYSGYANVIRNNIVYNNKALVKWVACQCYSDGNGIIIDDNKNTQINKPAYNGKTLVENNISFNNGAGGINIYSCRNVDVINNTTYNNSSLLNYGELRAVKCDNVRFYNNIAYARSGKDINQISNNINVVFDYNIFYNGTPSAAGANNLVADPKFVNASANDFHLQSTSPAINSGYNALAAASDIEGNPRPYGGTVDRGAYEYVGTTSVPVTNVTVNPTSLTLTVGYTGQLTATVEPANATNKNVSWSSSNTSVAMVNSSGLVTAVAAGSATITVTTQDGGKTATCSVTVTAATIPVSGVTVSPKTLSLTVGQTGQLTATVSPSDASNKNVSWSSSNTSVATVNSSGLVTAVAAGSATITVTTQDGGKKDNCSVTVTAADIPTPLIKLDFNENSGTTPANTGSVSANFTKTTPPNWSTNVPPNVGGASSIDFGTTTGNYVVESSSVISQLGGLGSFTITGWVNNKNSTEGSGGNRIVSWIKNGGNGVDLVYKSDGSLQLGINEWPDASPARSNASKITTDASASATNWKFFAVSYESASSTVKFYFGGGSFDATLDKTVTYNKGSVGTNIGKLAIGHFNDATRSGATDRMFRGIIDRVEIYNRVLSSSEIINVQKGTSGGNVAVTGVTVSPTSLSLTVGQTGQLTATVEPANATNKNVSWSSSNTSVATVNSSGLVTAVAAGSATITATTQDGGKTATCSVTVTTATIPVSGVTVSPKTLNLTVGQTGQLTATVSPSDASNKNVSWSSSNTSVATVNSSGLVTAVATGSATITVTTQDGGKTDNCSVTVTEQSSQNLVTNGEFDNGTTGWSVQNNQGATSSFQVVTNGNLSGTNAAKVCPINAGTAGWHIQLRTPAPVQSGKTYNISFMAKADGNRTISVVLQQGVSNYATYFSEQVSLTTSPQSFSYNYSSNVNDNTCYLRFFLGGNNTCVYIDKVEMKEVQFKSGTQAPGISTTNLDDYELENLKFEKWVLAPNPFHITTVLSKQSTNAQYQIFDMRGRLVKTGKVVNSIELGDDLKSGIYMLVIDECGKRTTLKMFKE